MNEQSNTTETAIDTNRLLTPVFPLYLTVNYDLANEFRQKVINESCKIENVLEISSGFVIGFVIFCPKEKEELITDFAFMTWIKNPECQKYYSGSKAFDKIAKQYEDEKQHK